MKACYLVISLLSLSTFHAQAQSDSELLTSFRAELEAKDELASYKTQSPLSRTDTANTGWELLASKDTKKVNLKWSPKDFYHLSFLISAPLDDDADKTSIYRSDTDAFVNSTSITVAGNFMLISPDYEPFPVRNLVGLCIQSPEIFAIEEENKENDCAAKGAYELLNTFKAEHLTPEATAILQSAANNFLTPFYKVGFSATYGNKSFTYFDPQEDFAEDEEQNFNPFKTLEEREHPYGVEAFFTYVKPLYFQATLGFEFQRDFETASDGKKETRCAVADSATAYSTCKDALIGTPERTFNRNIKLSIILPLKYYTPSVLSHVTISPVFTYNTANDVRSWKIPVYFIGDKDGNLSAGVTYDFESGEGGHEYFGFFLGGKY